ncbi:hypothetical protein LI951_14740 [Enterococcus sp. BWT-B8]|uniref:hypothetical protein n=1 Tax=unclassified Enterococcus TaxID=2608891 RepID=UPI001E513A4A|nr:MULTISPECIES: hypothetical protein [unclassified Enterococcus]MCB5953325.1 hypothetical protein [Enterococcus sp. BWT-B8]MCB5955747.1 hypothetical protein [Enterococcus sp. CWB-B31]
MSDLVKIVLRHSLNEVKPRVTQEVRLVISHLLLELRLSSVAYRGVFTKPKFLKGLFCIILQVKASKV